ncbi:MAG: hypothetical protein ACYSR5_07060 [Planctomycetota bacterium]|jgi:hypothetical protein
MSGLFHCSLCLQYNISKHRGKVGTAGEVSVGEVRNARYEHRNPITKRIDRVFGFQLLIRRRANEWEIEKPYLNYFYPDFKCYITADQGYVQVESATPTSRATPRDATFVGNVVVHIVPEASSDVKESFIYLDDIDYISERSLFTTAGPVRFVNEDARMLGKGLRLIYNEDQGRLEFLRVIHLDSLRLKSAARTAFSSKQTKVDTPTHTPDKTVVHDVPRKPEPAPTADKQPVDQNEGHYYKCVFSKNVLIETPDEMIFADRFFINNIFFKKSSTEETAKTDTADTESPEKMGPAAPSKVTVPEESEPNKVTDELTEVVVTCDDGFVVVPMDSTMAIADSNILAPGRPTESGSKRPEDMEDPNGRSILIAPKIDYCASSRDAVAAGPLQLTFYPNDVTAGESNQTAVPVKITAQKEAHFLAAANQAVFIGDCLCTMPQGDPCAQQDYTLSAPKLTVNLPEDKVEQPSDSIDILATGPVELVFYVDMNDSTGEAAKETTVPATVTAQRQARFLSASNQVVFEGDCSCTMNRQGLNLRREYTLSAPRLIVDLPKDKTRRSAASASSIEHLTADGGLVRLSSITRAVKQPILPKESNSATQGKVLGGIELKCARFDYDTPQQLSLATGPGLLKFYNSDESPSQSSSAAFDLEKPCWAFVENFETLRYLLEPNLIIADAGPYGALLISYYPIVNGKIQEDRLVTATAAHVEIALAETPDAQTELSTLTATGGITYEDQDKRFIGSRLFHDQRRSLITVRGDEVQPCWFNGVLQDWIEYDLITGKVKTGISAPGALSRKRWRRTR